jgi:hypothetical protein
MSDQANSDKWYVKVDARPNPASTRPALVYYWRILIHGEAAVVASSDYLTNPYAPKNYNTTDEANRAGDEELRRIKSIQSAKPSLKKRPRDSNQLAKRIADIATGEVEDREPTPEEQGKDPAAVSLGRRGGIKGGKARARSLSPEKRKEIASKAATARWKNSGG